MWHLGYTVLHWSPGSQGKGYVTQGEDIETWPVDDNGDPHHQQEWQTMGARSPMTFLFDIAPDGGIHDGGIGHRNTSGKSDEAMIAFAADADPRLHDGRLEQPDFDLYDQNPDADPEYTYDRPVGRDDGFGHAYRLMDTFSRVFDPLGELDQWLRTFNGQEEAQQPLTIHHDSPLDMVHQTQPSQANYPALIPPNQLPKQAFDARLHSAVEMPDPPKDIWPQIYGEDQAHCTICQQPTPEPGPCKDCKAMVQEPLRTASAYEWVERNAPQML